MLQNFTSTYFQPVHKTECIYYLRNHKMNLVLFTQKKMRKQIL